MRKFCPDICPRVRTLHVTIDSGAGRAWNGKGGQGSRPPAKGRPRTCLFTPDGRDHHQSRFPRR
jgi:hypothetical protein